jgi:F420-non-reducing hydrogenase iron-sulfur subunit
MTIKRMTFLQELLSFVGLGDRLHLDWISSAEAQKFARVVTDFTAKIKGMGPSPLSGRIDLAGMISSVEALPAAVSEEGG